MKIKARHKLIPAIAMLVVATVTLTSASYAWFTMSKTVKATGISLTAVAPNNLLIASASADNAANPGTFAETTTITLKNGNYGLMPASSNDGVTIYAPDSILSGTTVGAPNPTTKFAATTTTLASAGTTDATADGYYVDIPLWIATEGTTNVGVALSTSITTITPGTGTATEKIASAARFAVLTAASAKPAAGDYLFAGAEPSYFAAWSDGSTTGLATGTTKCNPVATEGTGAAAFAADNAVASFLTNGTAHDAASQTAILTVPAQTAGSVDTANTNIKCIVRVWIEGQDTNCINTAVKDLTITIGFKDVTYAE